MKTLLLSILMLFSIIQTLKSQTTLTAGDIAIVGYNADEVGNEDEFSFILLTDISTGTVINFTDFGWASDINGFPLSCNVANTSGGVTDGAITWTAPAGGLLFGTQVHIVCGGASLSASDGTVVGLLATANSIVNGPTIEYMSLSPGGDQIFAFQGTLGSPTLITVLGMNGAWDATLTVCEFNSSKSVLPTALNATNSFAIATETDNAIYNCSVTTGTAAQLRTAIFDDANWNVDNNNPFTLPISCFSSILPVTWLNQPKLILNGKSINIHWAVATQINNDKYIIEHSIDGRNFLSVGEIDGDGTNSDVRHYTFTHYKPLIGTNFYRIKQVDFDGRISQSNIVSLDYGIKRSQIAIYPNPVTDEVIVSVTENTEVTIFDMKGKIVKKQIIYPENNKVDVSELIEGVYIITFESNNRLRFIKN